MTTIRWESIPERYWPNTEMPWRVGWGFGMFRDFATKEEADEFFVTLDVNKMAVLPFNAVESAR